MAPQRFVVKESALSKPLVLMGHDGGVDDFLSVMLLMAMEHVQVLGIVITMGAIDGPVTFGDITIRPGDWLYADDDGIVVSPRRLH